MLDKLGAMPVENYEAQDFYLPFETTEALIEKGLIKDLAKEWAAAAEASNTTEASIATSNLDEVTPTEEVAEFTEEVAATEITAEDAPTEAAEGDALTENTENDTLAVTDEDGSVAEPAGTPDETSEEASAPAVDTTNEESATTLAQEHENVGIVFGVRCVFKPYYDGYELDELLEIPLSKKQFNALTKKKQLKVFKRAETRKKFKKPKYDSKNKKNYR